MSAGREAFFNAEWLCRLYLAAIPVQVTFIGDSTTTPGSSTSFCPYYMAALKVWKPQGGLAGLTLPFAATSPYLPLNCNVQNVTSSSDTQASLRPGEATPEGNTDGSFMGQLSNYHYNANRTTGATISRRELLDSSWIGGRDFFHGRNMVGTVWILRTPDGIPALQLLGRRNSVTINTAVIDCSSPTTGGVDETFDRYEVACGNGSTGSIEIVLAGGAGDESSLRVCFGYFGFYAQDDGTPGWILDTVSNGGWSTTTWTTSASVAGSPTYTATVSAQAFRDLATKGKRRGYKRVYLIQLGQNDANMTETQYRDNLVTLVGRLRSGHAATGEPLPGFILRSPPNLYGVEARFESYDRACLSAAKMTTINESPVMAVMSKRFSQANGTLSNDNPDYTASGDPVHPSTLGAVYYEATFWEAFMQEVRAYAGGGSSFVDLSAITPQEWTFLLDQEATAWPASKFDRRNAG